MVTELSKMTTKNEQYEALYSMGFSSYIKDTTRVSPPRSDIPIKQVKVSSRGISMIN